MEVTTREGITVRMPVPRPTATRSQRVVVVLCWLVTALGIGGIGGACPAWAAPSEFSDVTPDHWAGPAVSALAEAGVLEGTGHGRFEPDRTITRAEFVTAVIRARGFSIEAQAAVDPAFGGRGFGRGSTIFTDIAGDDWYRPYAALAYRLAISEGAGSGRFEADRPISRQEMAAIAVRAAGWLGKAHAHTWRQARDAVRAGFSDGDSVADWARPYVAVASDHDLIEGHPGGLFDPGSTATRAEAAVVLARLRDAAPPPPSTLPAGTGGPELPAREELALTATCYGPPGGKTGDWPEAFTYLGLRCREGLAAVDPSVIPLGTHLFIQGYGYAVAADVGSAVKGERIDIYLDLAHDALLRFGMRGLTVLVID